MYLITLYFRPRTPDLSTPDLSTPDQTLLRSVRCSVFEMNQRLQVRLVPIDSGVPIVSGVRDSGYEIRGTRFGVRDPE